MNGLHLSQVVLDVVTDRQFRDQVPHWLQQSRAISLCREHAKDGVKVFIVVGDEVLGVQVLFVAGVFLDESLLEMTLNVLVVPVVVDISIYDLVFDE